MYEINDQKPETAERRWAMPPRHTVWTADHVCHWLAKHKQDRRTHNWDSWISLWCPVSSLAILLASPAYNIIHNIQSMHMQHHVSPNHTILIPDPSYHRSYFTSFYGDDCRWYSVLIQNIIQTIYILLCSISPYRTSTSVALILVTWLSKQEVSQRHLFCFIAYVFVPRCFSCP